MWNLDNGWSPWKPHQHRWRRWGQGDSVECRLVGTNGKFIAVVLNCKQCMNAIDQEHKTSMNELTKLTAQLRQYCDAFKSFCLVLAGPRAQRLPSRGEVRVVCFWVVAVSDQHRFGSKEKTGCRKIWRLKGQRPYGQLETHGLTSLDVLDKLTMN